MEKCYSFNEDDFSYSSIEEAVELAWNDWDCDVGDVITIWEGDSVQHSASDFLPNIADYILDSAYDTVREWADSWEFSKEKEKSLQEEVARAVDEWATKHNMHPSFHSVKNIKAIQVRFVDEEGGFEVISQESGKADTKQKGESNE